MKKLKDITAKYQPFTDLILPFTFIFKQLMKNFTFIFKQLMKNWVTQRWQNIKIS